MSHVNLCTPPGEIALRFFATVNLLLGGNLGEIRRRIPARFWPPRFVLLGKNLGKICGRIAPRFWPPGFLLLGKYVGEFHGRILARFLPPGISLPGENPGGIPARFPLGKKILVAKILLGSWWDLWQDPAKIPVLILQGHTPYLLGRATDDGQIS